MHAKTQIHSKRSPNDQKESDGFNDSDDGSDDSDDAADDSGEPSEPDFESQSESEQPDDDEDGDWVESSGEESIGSEAGNENPSNAEIATYNSKYSTAEVSIFRMDCLTAPEARMNACHWENCVRGNAGNTDTPVIYRVGDRLKKKKNYTPLNPRRIRSGVAVTTGTPCKTGPFGQKFWDTYPFNNPTDNEGEEDDEGDTEQLLETDEWPMAAFRVSTITELEIEMTKITFQPPCDTSPRQATWMAVHNSEYSCTGPDRTTKTIRPAKRENGIETASSLAASESQRVEKGHPLSNPSLETDPSQQANSKCP